jgi:hypothetical protein
MTTDATLTTPKPKRRRLLGFVLALVAIYFIWGAARYPQEKRQQEAAIAIRQLGGEIAWWAELVGEPGYRKVIGVQLTGSRVTDYDLQHLRSLNGPGTVNLSDTKVTDAGLVHLLGLKRLTGLRLRGTEITDAGLESVMRMYGLQGLDLEHTQVTDAGLEHLRSLANLEWLWIRHTKVTEAGVKKLQQALPNCSIAW